MQKETWQRLPEQVSDKAPGKLTGWSPGRASRLLAYRGLAPLALLGAKPRHLGLGCRVAWPSGGGALLLGPWWVEGPLPQGTEALLGRPPASLATRGCSEQTFLPGMGLREELGAGPRGARPFL